MVGIERKFIPYPEAIEYSYRHSYSQATNVDKRESFVFYKVPVSNS
jgi:hypothetical protein